MKYLIFLLFFVVFSIQIFSQNDSLIIISQDTTTKKVKPVRNPTVAIALSAVLPGAGQIYNRKYYKIPIIYGVFGGVGYYIRKSQWAYIAYRNDILLMQDQTIPEHLKFPTTGISDLNELANNYNVARRQRDLFFIGGILWWTINVIDAYVDAELSDFDISDDLSLNFKPYFNTFALNPVYGLTFQFYF
ncbi:MAG: hypothetical protein JXR68_01280 [Bacteroidales bacterium]|nr:hypothetical protein [Bacteroidales bacterium]